MERAIMEAVARVDIFICAVPWGKIALSLVLAAIMCKAVKYL